jgi:hypothetical protein
LPGFRGHFVFWQSARGLAQSRTLRAIHKSQANASRLGLIRRPSAAFPGGISNCANVNWNYYGQQKFSPHGFHPKIKMDAERIPHPLTPTNQISVSAFSAAEAAMSAIKSECLMMFVFMVAQNYNLLTGYCFAKNEHI